MCVFVEPIPLQIFRYALFFDEYACANAAELFAVRRPIHFDGVDRHLTKPFGEGLRQPCVVFRCERRE